MDHQHELTGAKPQAWSLDSLNESKADLTMVCWTQLLREAEPETVGPQLPFDPLPENISPEQLLT